MTKLHAQLPNMQSVNFFVQVICSVCNQVSITFEPSMYLSCRWFVLCVIKFLSHLNRSCIYLAGDLFCVLSSFCHIWTVHVFILQVICSVCNQVSVTFEQFMYLSCRCNQVSVTFGPFFYLYCRWFVLCVIKFLSHLNSSCIYLAGVIKFLSHLNSPCIYLAGVIKFLSHLNRSCIYLAGDLFCV